MLFRFIVWFCRVTVHFYATISIRVWNRFYFASIRFSHCFSLDLYICKKSTTILNRIDWHFLLYSWLRCLIHTHTQKSKYKNDSEAQSHTGTFTKHIGEQEWNKRVFCTTIITVSAFDIHVVYTFLIFVSPVASYIYIYKCVCVYIIKTSNAQVSRALLPLYQYSFSVYALAFACTIFLRPTHYFIYCSKVAVKFAWNTIQILLAK